MGITFFHLSTYWNQFLKLFDEVGIELENGFLINISSSKLEETKQFIEKQEIPADL